MQLDLEHRPKTYVVINPVSGTLEPDRKRQAIQSALEAHNFMFELYETTGEENIRKVVREAVQQGFELFVAVGGDGTVAAVASGLVDTKLPLVVVPTGTWNALARNLDIPLQMEQALGLLFEEHRVRVIDVMQVEDNFHILNISAGAGARAMRDVEREHKQRFWVFADLWGGLTQLLGLQSYRFEVLIDNQQTSFRALEVMVANSRIIGLKSLQLDPDIRMDDGKLNVCRLSANNLLDLLGLAMSIILGKQKQNPKVLCLEAVDKVMIRARRKLPVQADGDFIGYLPILVKVRPKALHIVTPILAEV
ncbi:MAG TPA: diacylglycerol kinase family protein [Anaerolineales bacterium]|nr:diacylglycerol kinase family protein [Anaerolineales bacterium]